MRSHDHDHDEVLACAVKQLIARHAYREAARIFPDDRIELRQGARGLSRTVSCQSYDHAHTLGRKLDNVNPAIIPVRIWRHLYIQGRAPQEAAAQAAVSAYNARPAADRLRSRKR